MSVSPPAAPISAGQLHRHQLRGGFSALLSQATQLVLYTGTAVVLARLLTPGDYGLFGIALAVIAFLGIAKDAGMIAPVIQSKTISTSQLDTLFWFTSSTGALLALAAFALAPVAAWFYVDPRLTGLTRVLGVTFLIGGLSATQRALLRREMRFPLLAASEVIATLGSCVAALIAAWHGAGYWSLAWLYVTAEALETGFALIVSRWRPGWPQLGTGVRPLVHFGGLVMIFDLIGYLNYRFDNLVVAWYLGPVALGYYDKAYQFLLLPVNRIGVPIGNVAQAALSVSQNDREVFRSALQRCLLLVASLSMPLIAFLFGNTEAVVEIAFGKQWLPSVPVFRALAPAAFLMSVTGSTSWIYLSLGKARRQLPWAVLSTAVTISAFLIGARWEVWSVALALSISRAILFVPTLMFTCKDTPVQWTELVTTCSRPAASAVTALTVTHLLPAFGTGLLALSARGVIFTAVYAACWLTIPGGRALLQQHFWTAEE